MPNAYRRRRFIAVCVLSIGLVVALISTGSFSATTQNKDTAPIAVTGSQLATEGLQTLAVKGRAPKTGYTRAQFGDGWTTSGGCDTRNIILNRDMTNVHVDESCNVLSGILHDPYTGKTINFTRGSSTSAAVQIDHVVALSDAWQTGAQQLSSETRIQLANDPLELLAVDGPANQQKSDGDAATWLPPNKPFRCQYVARQVAVKKKYNLWVTSAEKTAIATLLSKCTTQTLPVN